MSVAAPPRTPHFSAKRAAEIAGVSYRQVDYWDRTHLVCPSEKGAAGSGSRRRYSRGDVVRLRVVRSLLDAGVRLESVRAAAPTVFDRLDGDLSLASVVVSGSSAWVARDAHELLERVTSRSVAGGYFVLPLADLVGGDW